MSLTLCLEHICLNTIVLFKLKLFIKAASGCLFDLKNAILRQAAPKPKPRLSLNPNPPQRGHRASEEDYCLSVNYILICVGITDGDNYLYGMGISISHRVTYSCLVYSWCLINVGPPHLTHLCFFNTPPLSLTLTALIAFPSSQLYAMP